LEAKGRTHGKVFRRVIDRLVSLIEPEHCYRAYLTYRRIRGVV
jgi:hypothetical protein